MTVTKRSRRGWKQARRRLTAGPCTICGRHCDPDLPVGHPAKATLHHPTPLAIRPGQTYVGTVRACARCNFSLGARPAPPPPPGTPSRVW